MSPNPDGTATPNEKARAIVAAVLGVIQALSLCGIAVGRAGEWLTGNEALVLGVLSALIGVAQTFLPSAVKAKGAPAAAPILLAVLALPLLAGCSYKGVTVGWGSIARETSTYSVQAAVMPDSNADVIHSQAVYTRKDGVVPNVEASVTRPEPNVAQVDVWVRGLAPVGQVAVPAPSKFESRADAQVTVKPGTKKVIRIAPVTVERTADGSCRGGVCPVPLAPLGQVDKELWQ